MAVGSQIDDGPQDIHEADLPTLRFYGGAMPVDGLPPKGFKRGERYLLRVEGICNKAGDESGLQMTGVLLLGGS
jgi:hypothetical protein